MRIDKIDYHRNGVGGEGFYVVKFHDRSDSETDDKVCRRDLIAVVFVQRDADGYTDAEATIQTCRIAVLEPANVGARWRGDVFAPDIVKAIMRRESAVLTGS